MSDWKEYLQYFKNFFETLAGKLTAILAFALLVIIALGWFGASIPGEYQPLVYILVIGAMLIFAIQGAKEAGQKRHEAETTVPAVPPTSELPKPALSEPQMDEHEAREQYLRAVGEDSRTLRLVGIDPKAADPSKGGLTLEALYISLDTLTQVDLKEKEKAHSGSKEEDAVANFLRARDSRPLSALEALWGSPDRRIVLLGLPGTGKSTFARYLALRMAQAELDRARNIKDLLPGWEGGTLLPVVISLGRLAETIPQECSRGRSELIETYIFNTLQGDERTNVFAPFILEEVRNTGGLFLLDGLDEVADPAVRPIVVQALEDFAQKYGRNPASRFLATCRTYSYSNDTNLQLTGWQTHELALLDGEKIERFIDAWHEEHARIEPARRDDYERKRRAMLASLQPNDRRRLHEIAPFPIILTMMAVVHTHYGELPDTRAQVYEKCVDLLLIHWELERPVSGQPGRKSEKRTIVDGLGITAGTLNRALAETAFEAHAGRPTDDQARGPALVTEELLTGKLQAHFQDLSKVKIFLDYCRSSNGLLMLQGTVTAPDAPPDSPPRRVYAFPHLTFEEYLAALHLSIRPNFGKATHDLVLHSDRWREVVLLMGEKLCFTGLGDQERMETLLASLSPESFPEKPGPGEWRAIWLAGELLTLYARAFPTETAPSLKRTQDRLYDLVVSSALSPRARAAAADTLDELGHLLADLYSFVEITRPPEASFWLARYPVTNAQYARFLEAEDYHAEKYWTGFPKFAGPEKDYAKIGDWGEEGYEWLKRNWDENRRIEPRYWRDPRFGLSRANAPVVGITWYEANAYCKWLRENWEGQAEGGQGLPKPQAVRLPSEAEWMLAAGGAQKERFSFGELKDADKEISEYANTFESGIGRTTPVWMYPQGASPAGVLDMTGNVFEWQANYRDEDHNYLPLRGGSWYIYLDYARVSYRISFYPDYWDYNFGFRVCVLPS